MKFILPFFIIFTLGLFGCRGKMVSVGGRIVQDCSGNTPYANQELHLRSEKIKGSGGKKQEINEIIKTNSNGDFIYTYYTKEFTVANIFIENLFGKAISGMPNYGINYGDSVNLGTLSLNNELPIRFVLNVSNIYSIQDTLIVINPFGSSTSDLLKFAGPFNNNAIIASGVKDNLPLRIINHQVKISYRLNYAPRIKLADSTFVSLHSTSVELPNCFLDTADVFITID